MPKANRYPCVARFKTSPSGNKLKRRYARSRDLLRLFVEHAPVALAMLDREMRYLAVSPRWQRDSRARRPRNDRPLALRFLYRVSQKAGKMHIGRALAGEIIEPAK